MAELLLKASTRLEPPLSPAPGLSAACPVRGVDAVLLPPLTRSEGGTPLVQVTVLLNNTIQVLEYSQQAVFFEALAMECIAHISVVASLFGARLLVSLLLNRA